ncbi:hypothetical protein EYF80_045662 [Liparis tanakae]|uniref:Uncharacterized protein n=1 Tax=Liparis tanakae TaxID=230148 RepID=A0A4Z2FTN9_9TELE|nr:hypothetical protein EYF80_045662 [Liparis tanakae]
MMSSTGDDSRGPLPTADMDQNLRGGGACSTAVEDQNIYCTVVAAQCRRLDAPAPLYLCGRHLCLPFHFPPLDNRPLGPGWVLGPGSWVLGPGSWVWSWAWVLGPGSWVLGLELGLGPGSWVLGPRSWVLGPGSWVLDLGPGSWVLGPGSWVLGPRSWVLGPGSWVLDPRSWVLGPGSWVLGPGSWVLGPGSWVLGPGSWVLGPGSWDLSSKPKAFTLSTLSTFLSELSGSRLHWRGAVCMQRELHPECGGGGGGGHWERDK